MRVRSLTSKILITSFLISGSFVCFADGMQNNIAGIYDASKVPTAASASPVLCVKASDGKFIPWSNGQSLKPYSISGNPYYFGAALRVGGCSDSDLYFGWLNVSKGQPIGYQPMQGSHIQLVGAAASATDISGHLTYTKIGPTDAATFPTNASARANWFTGVNLSGLEFSAMPNSSVIPDLSKENEFVAHASDLKDTATLLKQGANTIRVPIRWAYVQPKLDQANPSDNLYDLDYLNKLVNPTLATITSHGYNAILDLHSYMHYATVGNENAGCTGQGDCPQGALVTNPAPYVDVWSHIWSDIQKYNADSGNVKIDTSKLMLDIVNEPATRSDEQLSATQVFTMETAVIKKLRAQGFQGYFLLEGFSWSGLHSWQSAGNASVFTADNFHQAGITDTSKIIINVHQYLDSDYSGTHDTCLQDLNTTGASGFNLQAFVNYLKANKLKAMVTEFGVGKDSSSCSQPLNAFLKYVSVNAYTANKGCGFVGFTAWSTGHGWGDYNLRIKPGYWKDTILKNYFPQPLENFSR